MARKTLPPEKLFMGFAVKSGINYIQVGYDEESYRDIISKAVSLNLKPQDYLRLLAQPCQSCGSEALIINKINSNIKKKNNKLHQTHLFVFDNTPLYIGMAETPLKINYIIRAILSIPETIMVYTPNRTHKYNNHDGDAILTLCKNGETHTIINVEIKDNQIHPKK